MWLKMKNLTFSKVPMSVAALALLAGFALVGCGGGGGGSNDQTQQQQPITTTVGIGGGTINASDGSTGVTFDAGIVQESTSVNVTIYDAPLSPSSEIQAISQVVSIKLSPDAIIQTASNTDDTSGISLKIPIDNTSSAKVSKNISAAPSIQDGYSYMKASIGGVVLYGKYAIETVGNKTYATAKLTKQALSIFAEKAKQETVELLTVDVLVERFERLLTFGGLYAVRVKIPNDLQDPYTYPQPTGSWDVGKKLPLVLVHGIQLGCDADTEAYKETWKTFIEYFFSNQELQDKFELFTFSYQTDKAIKENGNLLSSVLKTSFGSKPVVVLAHSMGGLVARSAIVHDNAKIDGLITLGTPHHGTPIALQTEGVDVLGTLPSGVGTLSFLSCYIVSDFQGALDLRWDNFDNDNGGCNANVDNKFLCGADGLNDGLKDKETNYYSKYIPYAGEKALWVMAYKFKTYKSDGAVPEVSARFQDYYYGQYQDKSTFKLMPRSYAKQDHVSLHEDKEIVFPDIAYDLKGFYDSLTGTIPSYTTPPSTPTVLAATAASTSQINLTWAASPESDVAGYKVYKNGIYLKTVTYALTSDTGLSASTQYCYTVSAYDTSNNESPQSSSVCATTGTTPDTTPPTVSSKSPANSATNVAVNTAITATFSETMTASTVSTATFSLNNGVTGTVIYSGTTATFTPSSNLAYSTTYTATITTGVKDAAGNAMASNNSWTFTTASAPVTAPSSPTGVSAIPGNSQATISWNSVSGATSYNLYWSMTTGVTKTNGSKLANMVSPQLLTATNGYTYYFVVTAVNSYGESSESSQVSATPLASGIAPISLNQALFQVNTTNYVYGLPPAIPNIPISGAPTDTDGSRWSMLYDGLNYRLYFFKFGTNDTLYQFAYNPISGRYEYGYNSIGVLKIVGSSGGAIPADADPSSIGMLYDIGTPAATYRLYMRSKTNPEQLYQFAWNGSAYEYGFNNAIPILHITNGPADTDYNRWAMLYDALTSTYRYYAFQKGSNTVFYQFAFNIVTQNYEYGFNSIPILNLVSMPTNSNTNSFSMVYADSYYHLYFQTK